MVMSSMKKLLSYVKLTVIFERFCHLSRLATLRERGLLEFHFADRQNVFFFLRELSFADQKFYKNFQIVNFLKILSLCLQLILIM